MIELKFLAKNLSISGSYRKWILCYSLLVLFIALECFFVFYIDYRFGIKASLLAFFSGCLVSIIRKKSVFREKVSQEEYKKIRVSILTLVLIFIIEISMVLMAYFQISGAMVMVNILKCISVILLMIGVNSVVCSRMKNYKWMSIYVICLALILFCCIILLTLCDMSVTGPYGIEQLKTVGFGGMLVLVVFIFEIRWSHAC